MGKRESLIDFMNWYNNNPNEFADNERTVDLYIDSHSPTEPVTEHSPDTEFDTLQEGDWCEGTATDYGNVLSLENDPMFENSGHVWVRDMLITRCCVFDGNMLTSDREHKKTQLTPEEFLRRAENTFKTKYDEGN